MVTLPDVFFSYMRSHPEANQKLKECISRVLGIQRPIGPYREPAAAVAAKESGEPDKADQALDDLLKKAEENGVQVIID